MSHRFGTPIDQLPGSLPTTFLPDNAGIQSAVSFLSAALKAPHGAHFTEDALWRDWLVCHDRVCTICGSATIHNDWHNLGLATSFKDLQMAPGARVVPSLHCSWVSAGFTFQAQRDGLPLNCSGSAGVAWVDGSWKIFSLMTLLEDIDGYGNCDHPTQVLESSKDVNPDQPGGHYGAVIIGAGWNGLAMAGRFGALGMSYVLIEQDDEIGDCWSKRYEALKLHSGRETNNLPFDRTWSADDDQYLTGKQAGEGLKRYAKKYNINVWLKSRVEQAERIEDGNAWSMKVVKNGESLTVKSDNLIFATGSVLKHPNRPAIPGEADFMGTLMTAVDFKDGKTWKGKKAVVIGSATHAHDVAKEMVDAGAAEVHMVQRSPTAIFSLETYAALEGQLFNRDIPTMVSDRIMAGPNKHALTNIDTAMVSMAKVSPTKELHDELERAGFRVDRNAGFARLNQTRAGSYYLDVGASQYIIDGRIKVKSGIPISTFTTEGLAFEDGTEIKANVIIYCTGYAADYHEQVEAVIGAGKMKGVPSFWGLDAEGENQGQARDDVPGLWLMGGPAVNARMFSRPIALQIQMRMIKAKELAKGGNP